MKSGKKTTIFVLLFFVAGLVINGPATAITVKQENEISREFMRFIFQHYEVITDPEIAGYIQKLGDSILAHYPPQPFKYRFYVIKNNTYNAFAGPGAKIFIHSGLFMAFESEEELAGVIGHEISHVSCRHISKNIERSKKIGLGTLAGIAAGIFLGLYGDPAAGSAVTMGSIAGSQTISLAFSREDEMQADQIGLKYLTEAGYDAHGLMTSLDVIRSKQWFGQEQIPVYMTTHPAPEDRMGYIKNWIDANKEKIPDTSKKDYSEFNMAHTKLTAMYGEAEEARKLFKRKLQKDPDDIFGLYGKGIVLDRSGKPEEAIRYLKMALEKKAYHVGMLKTLGKVYYNSGMYANALSVFEGVLSQVPQDVEGNLYLGRTYAELGRLDDAANTLKPFGADETGNTQAYYYLGDIYSRKGDTFQSSYYLAMYYRNRGDARNALMQFKRARDLTNDPDLKKKIQTYIDTISGKHKKKKEKPAQEKSDKESGFRSFTVRPL